MVFSREPRDAPFWTRGLKQRPDGGGRNTGIGRPTTSSGSNLAYTASIHDGAFPSFFHSEKYYIFCIFL